MPTPKPHSFKADAEERLDVFLTRVMPEYSRSFLQKLCKEGEVTVDGNMQLRPSAMLHGAEDVVVMVPQADKLTGDIPVIYEDADVVVLNKPAGMLTHAKGALNHEFSVAEFMRNRTTDGTDGNRPGIVHRLDRGTSGVIICAKTPEARQWLQKQFSGRKVKKTYQALTVGHLKEPTALIRLPIERNPKKPQTFRVGGNGKPAETLYETTQVYKSSTLLKLMPHTGRTHQLRVHLQHIGHPIVGDDVYGSSEPKLGRMFLHAAELELTLPSRERRTFTAPLPTKLVDYLNTLQ